ncbi:MAG: protein-disulfide reductase DsbD [Pseudomonadota bacterium]
MKRSLLFTLLCLSMLAAAPLATAQTEPPPPPEEVFHYVVFDAGDALEIDWAVDDGYYMYRDWFGFETEGLVLGEPEMPEGKVYSDEFLGEQVIYRKNFLIRIPYTVSGARPDEIDLLLKSRGCSDGGFCYMPQSWTETVQLAAAKPKLSLDALAGERQSFSGGGQTEFPPQEEVFIPDVFVVGGNTVEVGIRIEPGYYIYKDKIKLRALSDKAQIGGLDLPEGKMKFDEYFGEQEVYLSDLLWTQAVARGTPEAMDLELELEYQGCADGGICYMPKTTTLNVSLPEATAVAALAAVDSEPAVPVSEQGRLAQIITGSSLWAAAGVFFLAGLGLAFTPCVLPMVPILSGIIAGEGDDVSPMRGFTLALAYVMGMAIVYTLAGVAAAAAGVQLQAMFNQPWVLYLFASLFVVLALAMFGVFELQMPSAVQSKLSSASGSQKSGTMIGAFVMGAISSLVVTACVAPALIAALTVMAQTGDMLRGGAALFAMSMGMGAPLLAVGAAQGKILPRVGPWMVAVKGAFGFMMLGLAIWMLTRVLPGAVTMTMWALLTIMVGVFLGGLTTLGTDSSTRQKLGKGFGLVALLYGIALFVGVMAGGSNPLKPLDALTVRSAAGPAGLSVDVHAMFKRIKTSADLDREVALAAASGKSALLDFYADWCVACKEMEAFTFPDPAVQASLNNTVMLQADVTANDDLDKELLDRFGVFGPPTIIFFGEDGEQRRGYEVVGYMKAKDFANHVDRALSSNAASAVTADAR